MHTLRTRQAVVACMVVFLLVSVSGAGQLRKEELAGIVNYTRVDATVACGGATEASAFAELKRQGFVSVINFRTPDEPNANIEASKEAAGRIGLKYFHIPFAASAPTIEVAETFLKTVANPANQPVYIHCASANRVGAMWLIKRVKLDGWDVEKAVAEAETIGLRSANLKAFALQYVKMPR